jgi:hypothetical protein
MSEVQHFEDYEDDGLSSFNLEHLGRRSPAFGSARVTTFNNSVYATREGEVIGPEREQILLGLAKIIQKFVGKKLIQTIVVPPKQPFPDIDAMNENAPKEEWGVDLNGKPAGPYQRVLVLKLLDAKTMDRYAFVTKSIGGGIAVGDLTDKVKIMRRLRGPNVTAVISCQSTTMRTSYNPRTPRPDFKVVRWIALAASPEPVAPPAPVKTLGPATATAAPETASAASEVAAVPEAPPTASETTAAPEAAPVTAIDTVEIGTVVLPPTLKEELKDEVPF